MISFIVKRKKLIALAESLLKSKGVGSHINISFPRALFTKNILLTRNIYKKEIHDQDLQFSENEKVFGKVIELGEDFDEVRIDGTEKKGRRKKIKLDENFKVDVATKINEKIIENKKKEPKDDLKKTNDYAKTKSKIKILRENSGIFSSLMTELKSRKNREKNQKIILEGKRLIHDAISAGCKPLKIFFSRAEDVENLKLSEDIKIYQLPYKSLGLWSDVVNSQGIIGIFEMPKISGTRNNDQSLPLTVICDNVRDPGNLGSILRIVAGVGCEKIILIKGCVDIWEPKVLRAAAGAHFRFPVINNSEWSDIEREICENSKVLLADFSIHSSYSQTSGIEDISETSSSLFRKRSEFSENLPMHCYYSLKYGDESTVIIIGGETQGLSDEAYKFALERKGSKIFIPMSNKIESLNNSVALGILVYEFRRQFDFISRAGSHLSAVNCNSYT